MYLSRLHIENLALVESLDVEFPVSVVAVTGETGAGKSMILGSIQLLLGERADVTLVRKGAEKAIVEGLFETRESDIERDRHRRQQLRDSGFDIDDDEPLILRREVSASGRSIAYVAGRMVPVKQLAELADNLVDIHSQHAQQSLVQRRWQRQALDEFAGTGDLAETVCQRYRRWTAVQAELDEWREKERDLRRQEDLYTYQHEEIKAAGLKDPGEEANLLERENILAHAEELGSTATDLCELFGEEQQGIVPRIHAAHRLLKRLSELDPALSEVNAGIEQVIISLSDLEQQINTYQTTIEEDPDALQQVQDRLHLISQLKKKYGDSIAEILAYAGTIEKQLSDIGSYEDRLATLEQQRDSSRKELEAAAAQLTKKRAEAALKLSGLVEKELGNLGMREARFVVALEPSEEITAHGAEQVELRIAVNPGEDLKPLAKVASGGELSRITLALKCITTGNDDVQILLFDEIDTGISAVIGQAVGERLQKLGNGHQVFVITHMPHIACRGDVQFTVLKAVEGNRTQVTMKKLDKGERRKEIARMLGGESEMTMAHADELFEVAHGQKARARK